MTDDVILPFQVADAAVRGRIVRLAGAADDILGAHGFADNVSALVGEAACLAAMAGAALKFDGKLIFQAQGDGPASMVVADYATDGALRATAKVARASALSGAALLGKGHVAMTIDQGPDMERYQGVTPLRGASLAEAAAAYFDQSEQVPTVMKLAVGRIAAPGRPEQWRAGGVMAQFVPAEGGARGGGNVQMSAEETDLWERSAAFIETVRDDELIDPSISSQTLLYRLFHEDGVRVFAPRKVRAACSCNGDKIAAVLERYSAEELSDMVEDGAITVTCEFCRKHYRFTPAGEPAGAS